MLGVAAALLSVGVFQYRWMLQSAQTERERQTRVLVVSMIQAVRAVLPFLPPDVTSPDPLPAGSEAWRESLEEAYGKSPFTEGTPQIITGMIFFPASGEPLFFQEDPGVWQFLEDSPKNWEPVIRRFFETVPDEPHMVALFLSPPEGKEPPPMPEPSAVMGLNLPGGGGMVLYTLDMGAFLTREIVPSLQAVLPDYEITWSRKAPLSAGQESRSPGPVSRAAGREFREEPRFSPWKALFASAADRIPLTFELHNSLIFRTSPGDRGNAPFIGTFKPQFFGNESPPGGIYLTLIPRGRSLMQEADRRLALNWLFSMLLLAGIGGAFFLLLIQGRRLRRQRFREREFVASVTHELRTPLTVIRSAAQNLREGIVPEDRRQKYGQLIDEQAQRLTRMVEGILLFSGMEGQKETPPVPALVDRDGLRRYLHHRVPLDQETGNPSRQVVFDWGGLPRFFKTDAEGLELILGNLLTNALIHTAPGDGPVKIKGRTRLPEELVFTVEDGGPGLPPREQKKLFTPFYRGSRSRENQAAGSGLGLYLSSRRAALAGGLLTLESPYSREDGKVRRGCRLTLIVPFGEAEND